MQMAQLRRRAARTTAKQRLPKMRIPALLARTEFQALIELAPDALLMIDEQGQIALVNHQAEVLFGYARQELLGQELECLLPERFHTLHLRHRHAYLQTPLVRPMGLGLDLYGRRKDSSEFHGGRIWFESVEERGSTFFIALPILSDAVSPYQEPIAPL